MITGKIVPALAAAAAAALSLHTAMRAVRKAVDSVSEGLQRIDTVAKSARKLGMTTEDMVGLSIAAEEFSGMGEKTFGMALQRMTRRIAEAANGAGEAKDTLKELGLSAVVLRDAGPAEAFRLIAEAVSRVKSEGDRLRIAFKLFDSEGAALVTTLAAGRKGLDEVAAAAEKLGATYSMVDAENVEDANKALGRMAVALEGIQSKFAIKLAPAVEQFANTMSKSFESDQPLGMGLQLQMIKLQALVLGFNHTVHLAEGSMREAWQKLEPMFQKMGMVPLELVKSAEVDVSTKYEGEADPAQANALEESLVRLSETLTLAREHGSDASNAISELGLSLTQLQASQPIDALKLILLQMTQIKDRTKLAAVAFRLFGQDAGKAEALALAFQSAKTSQGLKDFAEQIKSVRGDAAQLELAGELFGPAGGQLIGMLRDGADGLDKMSEAMQRLERDTSRLNISTRDYTTLVNAAGFGMADDFTKTGALTWSEDRAKYMEQALANLRRNIDLNAQQGGGLLSGVLAELNMDQADLDHEDFNQVFTNIRRAMSAKFLAPAGKVLTPEGKADRARISKHFFGGSSDQIMKVLMSKDDIFTRWKERVDSAMKVPGTKSTAFGESFADSVAAAFGKTMDSESILQSGEAVKHFKTAFERLKLRTSFLTDQVSRWDLSGIKRLGERLADNFSQGLEKRATANQKKHAEQEKLAGTFDQLHKSMRRAAVDDRGADLNLGRWQSQVEVMRVLNNLNDDQVTKLREQAIELDKILDAKRNMKRLDEEHQISGRGISDPAFVARLVNARGIAADRKRRDDFFADPFIDPPKEGAKKQGDVGFDEDPFVDPPENGGGDKGGDGIPYASKHNRPDHFSDEAIDKAERAHEYRMAHKNRLDSPEAWAKYNRLGGHTDPWPGGKDSRDYEPLPEGFQSPGAELEKRRRDNVLGLGGDMDYRNFDHIGNIFDSLTDRMVGMGYKPNPAFDGGANIMAHGEYSPYSNELSLTSSSTSGMVHVGDMSKFQPGEPQTDKLISAINEVRTAIVDKDAVILETAEAD